MLTYIPLNSGSSGNCALLFDYQTLIVMDAGITHRQVVRALQTVGLDINKFENIVVLVTHKHMDHAKHIGSWIGYTQHIFAPFDVYSNPLHDFSGVVAEDEFKPYSVGMFDFETFEVKHDVRNWGYTITHGDDKIFFMTDAVDLPKDWNTDKFKNFTMYLIESNWDFFIDEARSNMKTSYQKYNHQLNKNRHLNSGKTRNFLAHNIGPKTLHVQYLHLPYGEWASQIPIKITKSLFEKGLTHVNYFYSTHFKHGDIENPPIYAYNLDVPELYDALRIKYTL